MDVPSSVVSVLGKWMAVIQGFSKQTGTEVLHKGQYLLSLAMEHLQNSLCGSYPCLFLTQYL